MPSRKCGKLIIKGGSDIRKDYTRVEGHITYFQKFSCMFRRDDKLQSSPELASFLRVCATLVNMRSVAGTPAATKGRETSPVRRSTRGKALSQRDDTESSSNEEELYELKPRKAKNLAMDLMHPLQDFQTHLDVTTEQNRKWLQDIGLAAVWGFAMGDIHTQYICSYPTKFFAEFRTNFRKGS